MSLKNPVLIRGQRRSRRRTMKLTLRVMNMTMMMIMRSMLRSMKLPNRDMLGSWSKRREDELDKEL